MYFDEAQHAMDSLSFWPARGLIGDLVPSRAWLNAMKVLTYDVTGLVWKWIMMGPGTNRGSVLVNAGVVNGDTGNLSGIVQVIDI